MNFSRKKELDFPNSHAFVIGINEYRGLNANLKNAVNDAANIAMRLKATQGFDNVLLMTDVGKKEIDALLNWLKNKSRPAVLSIPNETFTYGEVTYSSDVSWLTLEDTGEALVIKKKEGEIEQQETTNVFKATEKAVTIGENDSIIFYYAGHGFPGEVGNGPAGYLAPTDAIINLSHFGNDSLVTMEAIYDAFKVTNCKHTLMILDCCFAGKFRFTELSRGRPKPFLVPMYERRYKRYKQQKAWQVLVSAGPDQTAADAAGWADIRENSPFAATLIEALEGKADIPISLNRGKQSGDGIITVSELFLYVWDKVENLTQERKLQHPGLFPMAEHRNGEFIFLNPQIDPAQYKFAEDKDKNPYKGLKPYEVADKDHFFGRTNATNEVLAELEKVDVLFITAPSGFGKSSLVKAGVFSQLTAVEALISIRPGALVKTTGDGTITTDVFEATKTKLLDFKASNYLFLIDQLEELFDTPQKETIEKQLLALLKQVKDHGQKAIITLRSDFEWQMRKSTSTLNTLWKKENIYRLAPMDLDELRDALTGPAWWAMFDFQDKKEKEEEDDGETLINEILEEIANAPGALPLLSFTMEAFYELAQNNDRKRRLILKDYRQELGGVQGALSRKADTVYNTNLIQKAVVEEGEEGYENYEKWRLQSMHTKEEQEIMKNLLCRMVQLSSGGALSKRRVFYAEQINSSNPIVSTSLSELIFPQNQELVDTVIRKLETAHLIIKGIEGENGKPYIEPVHDALFNHWDTFKGWIEAFGKENLLLQRQLWEAVVEREKKNSIA